MKWPSVSVFFWDKFKLRTHEYGVSISTEGARYVGRLWDTHKVGTIYLSDRYSYSTNYDGFSLAD